MVSSLNGDVNTLPMEQYFMHKISKCYDKTKKRVVLEPLEFSQEFTRIKVFLDQLVIIQMCFKYFYAENPYCTPIFLLFLVLMTGG